MESGSREVKKAGRLEGERTRRLEGWSGYGWKMEDKYREERQVCEVRYLRRDDADFIIGKLETVRTRK
jgi:hypothetical protein